MPSPNGCAAGAMPWVARPTISKPKPDANVLIIAVELPSLTFQRKDISQANLISSILFGEWRRRSHCHRQDRPGPKILVSETYTFPDSLGAMGFDLRDSGFHIPARQGRPK